LDKENFKSDEKDRKDPRTKRLEPGRKAGKGGAHRQKQSYRPWRTRT